MATGKITKKLVDATAPGERDQFVWDMELRGFGLKVTRGGRKVYLIQYRLPGQTGTPTRFTIGAHGRLTPDGARGEAKRLLGLVEAGEDPAAARRRAKGDITVSHLCDLYLETGVTTKKASTLIRDRSRIEAHIKPVLGSVKVQALTRADVKRLQDDVSKGATARDVKTEKKRGRSIVRGGEGAARECVVLLGSILSFAVENDHRPDNPAKGIKKFKQRKMQRFLSAAELAKLGQALAGAEAEGNDPFAVAALRLLILTGARKGEILGLQWPWVKWDHAHLALPDSKTGEKVIRLGPPALEGLHDIRDRLWDGSSNFVIQGRKKNAHLIGLQKIWERIRKRAGLDDVRIHDLRHSFASVGATGGDSLLVIGAVLGHKSEATTKRYAHLSDDPIRQATDRISTHIATAMGGNPNPDDPGADVVPLKRR
jgi:integrase